MSTMELLAAELRNAGLPDLAEKAEAGAYSVTISPHALPELELAKDLEAAHTPAADALAWRCISGEFGPTDTELDIAAERILMARFQPREIAVKAKEKESEVAARLRIGLRS